MRKAVLIVLLISPTTVACSEPIAFPGFDIAKACRDQANYAFAATLGDVDVPREVEICSRHERDRRDAAQTAWSRTPGATQSECARLAEGRYSRLALCLDDTTNRHAP